MMEAQNSCMIAEKIQDETSESNDRFPPVYNLLDQRPRNPIIVNPIPSMDILNLSDQQELAQIKQKNQQTNFVVQQELTTDVCNLCKEKSHKINDCPKAKVFYHATDRKHLDSILKNGFIPNVGRLGKAVYVSDSPLMCIKFVYRHRLRFENPIILKVKVNIDDSQIHSLTHNSQIKNMTLKEFNEKKIKAIKCPYYCLKDQNQTKYFFEFALYKADYAVVSWSNIKFPEPKKHQQGKETKIQIQENDKKIQSDSLKIVTNKKSISKEQRSIKSKAKKL